MLTFLHPKLMPIISTAAYMALKQLTKEIYANVRALFPQCGVAAATAILALSYLLLGTWSLLAWHFSYLHTPVRPPLIYLMQCIFWLHRAHASMMQLLPWPQTCKKKWKATLTAIDCFYLAAFDNLIFGFAKLSVTAMLTHQLAQGEKARALLPVVGLGCKLKKACCCALPETDRLSTASG